MGKTIKDFLLEDEYLILRQYYENCIEAAEEAGDDETSYEKRLEDLDEMWYEEPHHAA